MKAIRFAQYGEPAKVLAAQERPLPEPGKGEVRIRILASPVNPSDLLFVRGQYAGVQPHFPSPVGFEGVGMVDALGPQVHRPIPGQRVAVLNEKGGNWADYAMVPALSVIPVPDGLPNEQVASFIGERLETWLEQVGTSQIPELLRFAGGIERDKAAVQAALLLPYSNGVVEAMSID